MVGWVDVGGGVRQDKVKKTSMTRYADMVRCWEGGGELFDQFMRQLHFYIEVITVL